jgi:hypothetical protein
MKFREISGKIALVALAAVCLMAVPALSMPMDNGPARQEHGGMFAAMNNLTAEEMGNMTLGELKEMRRQAWNNATACLAKETGRNCSQRGIDANESLGMKGKCMGEKSGRMGGEMCSRNDNKGQFDKGPQGMSGASPVMLLMGDLTVEDLGNMTVNQIKALSEKKKAELDNMTLAEIKLLGDKKAAEKENMTLNQLKEEQKNMRQIAQILEVLGTGSHNKA